MQTILGANGQIADELAKNLKRDYTSHIKLVSRNPQKIHETNLLFAADLLDAEATNEAVKGSDIAYLTVGLPMKTVMWEKQFPAIMQNVINACKMHRAKLVFFDNTYMYPQNEKPLTEETEYQPVGRKGEVRALLASMLLQEIESGQIEGAICRAPEFYGPGKTKSFTNTTIFENIRQGKPLQVLISDTTLRTLIWTPDAGRAMALIGNTPDAYNQAWHLPCDHNRHSYKQFISLASRIYGKPFPYSVLNKSFLKTDPFFSKQFAELEELLPRYACDNIFDSGKFKKRFPGFDTTTYEEGITQIMNEQRRTKC